MSLPKWNGASAAYTKAYRILEKLASKGGATPAIGYYSKRGKWIQDQAGWVSPEMKVAIDSLNKGDEEAIKAFNLKHLDLQF